MSKTENTATPTATPVATVDETALSETQRTVLGMLRDAAADGNKAAAKDNSKPEVLTLNFLSDLSDEECPGISAVRDAIAERVAKVIAESGAMSDDERKSLRQDARSRYDSAMTVLAMPAVRLPEGFVLPEFPGGSRGGNAGLGGEKPRNLKHTAKIGDKQVEGTFAVLSGKSKVPTAELLEAFKAVAGAGPDDWAAKESPIVWTAGTGDNTFEVSTTYTAPK